jgi:ATP-dependent RNA helicase DeaD
VHRIGRTGRAGRNGEAILFVTPREKRLLQAIERATRQPIEEMQLPGVEAVNDRRVAKFKQRIGDTLGAGGLEVFQQVIEQYQGEHDVPAIEIAAALARIVHGNGPFLLKPAERQERPRAFASRDSERPQRRDARADGERTQRRDPRVDRDARNERSAPRGTRSSPVSPSSRGPMGSGTEGARDSGLRRDDGPPGEHTHAPSSGRRERHRESARSNVPEPGFETFRIEVGNAHGVKPGNIVGAIANEAGLDSKHIGRIDIREDHSFVDLPEGMPSDVFKLLKKVWVSGQQLRITRSGDAPGAHKAPPPARDFAPRPSKPAGFARPKRPKPGKPTR